MAAFLLARRQTEDVRMNERAATPFTPGLLHRLVPAPRKVALLRPGRLGDVVCATSAFRALRRALPEAELTLIGLPFARELVARSPTLDRFVAFPGSPGITEQWFEARCTTAFFAAMQDERFDLAIQMYGSGVFSNPVTLLLGARATAGFIRAEDGPGLLDAAMPWAAELHEVRRPLALTAFLGAPPEEEHLDFPLWPEDHRAAEALLRDAAPPLIGVHPSAREAVRRWLPTRFAAAATALQRIYGGTTVVLCAAEDAPLARAVTDVLPGPYADLTGRTSVPVLGAVIARLAVLITNDSGPAQIAYALRTPTVTIFGGNLPAHWGPLHAEGVRVLAHPVPCRPCTGATCPVGYRCLTAVSIADVVRCASEVMRCP